MKDKEGKEDCFRNTVEVCGDFTWELDCESRYVYVSDLISENVNMPKEQILNRTPFEFMVPEDAERVKNLARVSIKQGLRAFTTESRFFRHDGRKVWLEIKAEILYDKKGGVAGFRGTSRDITQIKEENDRCRSVTDIQKAMICRSRPDTTITYVNPAYAMACNKSYKDLIGRKLTGPGGRNIGLERPRAVGKDNPSDTREIERMLPDGSIAWYEWTNHAIISDEGEIVEYVSPYK